jgi:ketosteroid isomerase-like protein
MTHAPSAWKQPAPDQAAEVEKLDRELSAAGVRGDLDASTRLIADAAIFVHVSGKTTTKADNLALMKSADYKLESETFEDIHSKQFGDTVVLWGRVTAKGMYKHKPFRDTFNFTDVWQSRNTKWQQVFTRATPVGKP